MENKHDKLFDLAKKKIGIEKSVYDKIILSGDMFEWSIAACLHASKIHD